MILRIWVMGTRSPGMAAGARVGSGLADGAGDATAGAVAAVETAGAADGWLLSRNAMMSCLVMRPPRPVPETCDRFTLCSRAILRTRGEERAWSSSSCGN